MKTTVFIATALAILTAACSKPNERKSEAPAEPGKPEFRPVLIAANPKNPFDSAGIYHNLLLDSAQQYLEQHGKAPTKEVCTYMTKVFARYYSIDLERFKKTGSSLFVDLKRNATDPTGGFKGSPKARGYATKLFQIVAVVKDNDFGGLKKQMINLESEIMNSTLSKAEKELLLGTASVARHSAARWLAIGNGPVLVMFPELFLDPNRIFIGIGGVVSADTKAYLEAKDQGYPEPVCALFSATASFLDALRNLWPF